MITMETLLTTSNITFGLGILAILFSVYNYFRGPQVDGDKRDALLAQELGFIVKNTDERFKQMQDSFQALLLQSANHIHTVDTKVEALNATVGVMGNKITELATIIDERIPRKTL